MSALPLARVAAAPLVSVVMATHAGDDPHFLRTAVDSVRAQTYPNLELLIVADGALTEHTDAYLSRLPDHRVRLLRLARNGGPARARNAGIEAAAGEYIAIMDADDVCAPDSLARQLEFLLATGSDVVGSSYVEIDGRDAIVGRKRMPATCAAIRARCAFFNPINNPTAFARAEVLKRHRYPEHLRLGEDYRLWIRLLRAGYVVNNHEAPLLRFRRGDEFFRKRRGLGWALSDVGNKLSAVGLVRWYARPAAIAFAFLTFGLRLLPPGINRVLYRARRGSAP